MCPHPEPRGAQGGCSLLPPPARPPYPLLLRLDGTSWEDPQSALGLHVQALGSHEEAHEEAQEEGVSFPVVGMVGLNSPTHGRPGVLSTMHRPGWLDHGTLLMTGFTIRKTPCWHLLKLPWEVAPISPLRDEETGAQEG